MDAKPGRFFLLINTLPEANSSHLKIDPLKRRFLLETISSLGYLSFREGSCFMWLVPYLVKSKENKILSSSFYDEDELFGLDSYGLSSVG